MRIGAWSRSARSPTLLPSVTMTWVGLPRRLGGAFWAPFFSLLFSLRASAPRAASGTRAPNMSERITEIAERTKIHRMARKAILIRKRVSSDTGSTHERVFLVLDDPHGHRGVADPDLAAVADTCLGDLVAVDEHAVGGAEVADLDLEVVLAPVDVRAHVELDVPTAHAGVVDADVGLGAAPDHHPRRLQRVPGPVDLEDGTRPAHLRVGGVALHPRLRPAADPEPAGGEVVGPLELDADRPRDDVALRVRVVLDLVGELVGQRGVVRREPVEVDLAELDMEVVGDHPPLTAEDLGVVVALPLQGGGDLDRLHRAAEGLGEGSGDEALQALLEPLQPAHVASFRARVVVACE